MVIAVLGGAMQMLAGAREMIVFTWTMLGVLWLGEVWQGKIPFWRGLRRFVLIVILITGLSAIQLLPFFDLLKYSDRGSTYLIADVYPMPVWGWANFVVPFFHCLRTAFGTCLQPGQAWTDSYYLGAGSLVLAWVAAWHLRRRLAIVGLVGITLVGLVLALGESGYVYGWLRHVAPGISFARYPIKFVSIPAFTIPLLAAFGFNGFLDADPQSVKQQERLLLLATVLQLLLVISLLAMARWWLPPVYDWGWTWWDGILRAFFLMATIGAMIALVRVPAIRLRRLLGFVVLALIGFDLITVGMSVNPTVVTKAYGPLQLNMTFRPKLGESRAMLSRQVSSYLDNAWTSNPLYYFVGVRGVLVDNCNIPADIPKVDGFCSLHLKDEWDIDGIMYGVYLNSKKTNPPPAPPLLNFLGVSQITATNTIFAWQERKSFLPLATAGQRPIYADAAQTMKALESTNFDPRHTVYLPLSAEGKVTVSNVSSTKIVSQQFKAQQVHLIVKASAPALVVVAQAFYHDWHAYVDGKHVPLLRANHAFQAIEVPAGQHEITLRYEDWMFRLGVIISALTLLGCLTGLFLKPGCPNNIQAAEVLELKP